MTFFSCCTEYMNPLRFPVLFFALDHVIKVKPLKDVFAFRESKIGPYVCIYVCMSVCVCDIC